MKSDVADITMGIEPSPPSRGAWIEMSLFSRGSTTGSGRPPRGGRGLKSGYGTSAGFCPPSPPSRGAWIEIASAAGHLTRTGVAPLAGGVD